MHFHNNHQPRKLKYIQIEKVNQLNTNNGVNKLILDRSEKILKKILYNGKFWYDEIQPIVRVIPFDQKLLLFGSARNFYFFFTFL